MKNIIWVISGIVFVLSTVQQVNNSSEMNAKPEAGKIRLAACEDEPIIVRGHVKNGSGNGIVGASVKLKKNGVTTYQTTTNSSGYYNMSSILADSYVLHLSADGYVTKTVDLNITDMVVRIDTLIAQ